MNETSVQNTAGLEAFLILFGLALVVWFLGWDLTRRLRRMRRQAELQPDDAARASGEAGPGDMSGEGPGEGGPPPDQPAPGDAP